MKRDDMIAKAGTWVICVCGLVAASLALAGQHVDRFVGVTWPLLACYWCVTCMLERRRRR
jgi:hypothetical protein